MEVYGLIGNPVGHSLSPVMQEAGFESIGREARYVTFEPEPSKLGDAIAAASTLGIRGLNVTIPFKEDALEFVDADDTAATVGAVNTIDFGSDPPQGHNTDVEGAMRALDHHNVNVEDRTAVLVGAGGAARAIGIGLVDAGAEVIIANRTVDRADRLADDLDNARSIRLDGLADAIAGASILINATSVGMESDATVVPATALHGDLVVMDAVYRPLETRLLRDADAVGAETIDGAWMLLYQGVRAFERWTGEDAPTDVMNAALREAL